MPSANNVIYRIQFKTDENDFDIYVRNVYPSDMNGFICIEGFLFREETSSIINPKVEQLLHEFHHVETAFIPYYQISRIDAVSQAGESKIKARTNASKVTPFLPQS